MGLKPIGKGNAGEPSYVRGQREWGVEVGRRLGSLVDRSANVTGGGTMAAGKLSWRQDVSFAAQFKHRAEFSTDRPLVVNAGYVVFPSARTTVAEAEVSLPVSGDLYVYIEINPVTKACSIASNATVQQYDQSATSKRIVLGIIEEVTTGAWSWTQYQQGDQFVAGAFSGYGVNNGGAWVEITAEPSSGNYSWKQKDADATTDSSPSVTGTGTLQEVSGRTGIPTGSIVWAVQNGSSGYKTEYDGGASSPLDDNTYSGEHAEAARSSVSWDRSSQGTDRGLKLTVITGIAYYDTGDETLYAYAQDMTFDANGHLIAVSAETRITVDVPEVCT